MEEQTNSNLVTNIKGHALWITAIGAIILSIIANLLVLLATKPLAPDFMSLTVMPVAFWSVIAAVGAAIVFALTRKYAEKPNRTFIRISWIVFLLSFFMDIPLFFFDIEFFAGATTGGIIALMAMHVVVFATTVPILVKFTRPRNVQLAEEMPHAN
jgi:hypothetical protein